MYPKVHRRATCMPNPRRQRSSWARIKLSIEIVELLNRSSGVHNLVRFDSLCLKSQSRAKARLDPARVVWNWPVFVYHLACSLEQICSLFPIKKRAVWRTFCKHYSVFKELSASRFALKIRRAPRQGQEDILTTLFSRVKAFDKVFYFLSKHFLSYPPFVGVKELQEFAT